MKEIDKKALEIVVTRSCLPPCLHIPIAAKDKDSISKYIGIVSNIYKLPLNNKALKVQIEDVPQIDYKYPIWKIKESLILHQNPQVWVHVDYKDYRKAYKQVFPDEDLTGFVLDHIMNRKLAKLKGYNYLRIIPVHRGVNSSSGVVAEQYGIKAHSTPEMIEYEKNNQTFIQYADVADIVKMLNIKTGGSYVDGINNSLYLFFEE